LPCVSTIRRKAPSTSEARSRSPCNWAMRKSLFYA
jgi:hypothetical protein